MFVILGVVLVVAGLLLLVIDRASALAWSLLGFGSGSLLVGAAQTSSVRGSR